MKSLFISVVILLLCKQTTAQADGTKIKLDFKNWPGAANQTDTLQSGVPFLIVVQNIDKANFAILKKNSTITGKYDTGKISKNLVDYADSFFEFDSAKSQGTIIVSRLLSKYKKSDSVVFTIKTIAKDTGVKITVAPPSVKNPSSDNSTATTGANTATIPDAITIVPFENLKAFRDANFTGIYKTDVGFKMPGDFYTIHIFLDEMGNPLFGSMPTGIQNKYHYTVHILYNQKDASSIIYSLTNISGSLNDIPVTNSVNVKLPSVQQGEKEPLDKGVKEPEKITVQEMGFTFFPTTDDLKFDVNAIIISAKNEKKPVKLASYSIKKTAYYSSSINIGGTYSWLSNPTFELVNSPVNAGKQTVKSTNNTTGLMVSLLYTVYWSPVNALFKSKSDKKYSAWGRSYLDDNNISIVRKIYPCIGFGLKDQVFTNIIAGLNCQPVNELGIFIGWNIKKINTFNMPNFTEGQTDVTQDQFNFYQNTKWKGGFSFGVVLDVSVFSKMLGNISAKTSN
jgi:hypothetical protein